MLGIPEDTLRQILPYQPLDWLEYGNRKCRELGTEGFNHKFPRLTVTSSLDHVKACIQSHQMTRKDRKTRALRQTPVGEIVTRISELKVGSQDTDQTEEEHEGDEIS